MKTAGRCFADLPILNRGLYEEDFIGIYKYYFNNRNVVTHGGMRGRR